MGRIAGQTERLGPDLRRVLAPNPSPMTERGTNSYILGTGMVAVIDPGPDDAAHLAALTAALAPDERVTAILVTHPHRDHSGLAPALAAATGAPVYAFGPACAGRSPAMAALAAEGGLGGGEGVDAGFAPDIPLADGETVEGPGWRVEALWTPGHMSAHLAFRWGKRIFTGDVVMGWASTLISPPDGELAAFRTSLARLAALGAAELLPGHGDRVTDPAARIAELLAHRRMREAAILAALAAGASTIPEIAARVYADTPGALHPAAHRNILAHLLDLQSQNRLLRAGSPAPSARWQLSQPALANPLDTPGPRC